jgi:hypothetical protein
MLPKISCICPTRDRFETLREAVSFFLLQDYPNKELIIFNNHPDPITPHPKLIKHGIKIINAGDYSGKSMETVYAHTLAHISDDSEYVAVWDDDDMYFPWHLSSNLEKLIKSGKQAIRSTYGYWQDINHSMKDDFTIVRNTLEASMVAKRSCIFFNEDIKDSSNPEYTHPHTSWVVKTTQQNGYEYNNEITANFRWGYGKTYHHLQSVGPHRDNGESGNGQMLRPKDVKHLFYNLIEKAYLTTDEVKGIITFTSETKTDFFRKITSHNVDKFEHIDKYKAWVYWNNERPVFIKECHQSIIENTFAEVVILNDEALKKYQLPEYVTSLHPVQKSDYLRIHLLYNYGGWWFDSDTFVIGDLDEHYFRHLSNHENVFPWEYNVPGNITTPIFSSKPFALVIRQALTNIDEYLKANPQVGWSGIGVNGILKAVETYKHRGDGYFYGLSDIATYGYNNGLITEWDFSKLATDTLQMIIFHWSQMGAEVSSKIDLSESGTVNTIVENYPNLEPLFKLYKKPYL